jgi:hypothetical protein
MAVPRSSLIRRKIVEQSIRLDDCEVDDPSQPGRKLPLKPCQFLVTVSFTLPGIDPLPSDARKLPALVDTGHGHTFSCRREHLSASDREIEQWLHPRTFLRVRDAHGLELLVPRLRGNLWLHPNIKNWKRGPYRISLIDQGWRVTPRSGRRRGPRNSAPAMRQESTAAYRRRSAPSSSGAASTDPWQHQIGNRRGRRRGHCDPACTCVTHPISPAASAEKGTQLE